MTRRDAVTFIRQTAGKVFAVAFVKRGDGSLRVMNCRLGVKKHLRGGPQAYDPADHGLIVVYDMASRGYRSIPVDSITGIEVSGQWEAVEGR